MKQRLISIAVGLTLLAAVLFWYDTLFLNAVIAVIGALAIYEAIRALGLADNVPLIAALCGLHAANMFFSPDEHYFIYLSLFAMFLIIMLTAKECDGYKKAAGAFGVFIMVTLGFGSVLRMRDMATFISDKRWMFFMGLALGWICDTFAFFTGKLLGKKKLCPTISPNKTVAGAVGGLVGTPIFTVTVFFFYTKTAPSAFEGLFELKHILFYAAMGLVGAFIGIVGDLAASYIKRECKIKDFGNIMPGHGGALDRMDSVLFTSTFACFAFELFFKLFA